MSTRRITFLAALAMFVLAHVEPAVAGKSDDTLKIALPREMETLNVYSNTGREGVIMSRMIWDGLLYRDPVTNEYIPNLATSYRWESDTALVVGIREGIKFHNGEPFDADDVVYTLNWVANPSNGALPARNVNWIESAEEIGPNMVRINLKAPFPAALEYLSGPVVIYPNEYFAEVGPVGIGKAPVGTGPYRATSVEPGKSVMLEKYDGYHEDSPKGQPSIGKIFVRTIPEKNTQIAEMLSGNLDWIWQVLPDQASKIDEMGRFTVANESTMRIGYLSFDAAGRHGDNPMNDVRVRKAVAHAIDRDGILEALVRGASKVVHSACFPTQFGCSQDVITYDYDLEKAKSLLAEAGYTEGFEMPFHAYRERDQAEAIINNLAAIGIKTNFSYLKYQALREKIHAGEIPFRFMTWGSYSVNDASAITSHFFKHGPDDYARDPDLKVWLETADTSTDPGIRKENYLKALRRIAEEVYWLPLWSLNTYYVYTKDLEFMPTPDEIPRFFQARWK